LQEIVARSDRLNPAGPLRCDRRWEEFLINSGDVKEESQPPTLVQNWPAELKK
jgi:hypothetical protein